MSTLNLYLDKKSESSLKKLQKLFNSSSKADTIRKALTLSQVLREYQGKGYRICVENGTDKKEVIIT